tara:strand:- start:449 stop:2104 length:1656 start_codon:yes stop_codon:yes gene_type:complete
MDTHSDPIFGRGCLLAPEVATESADGVEGLRVASPASAVEISSMCKALGHMCAVFFNLTTCPYCKKFTAAWNEACRKDAAILWLTCPLHTRQDVATLHANLGSSCTFPCLLCNGIVHQLEYPDESTSQMSASAIHKFVEEASARPMAEEIDIVEEGAEDEGGVGEGGVGEGVEDEGGDEGDSAGGIIDSTAVVDTADLISEHESEEEDGGVDQIGDDALESDDSIGDGDLDSDDDDHDDHDDHEFMTTTSAAGGSSVVVKCYFMNGCGGCTMFRPEWNEAVRTCKKQPRWVAIDVHEEPEEFAKTGASYVPHIEVWANDRRLQTSGPVSTKELLHMVKDAQRRYGSGQPDGQPKSADPGVDQTEAPPDPPGVLSRPVSAPTAAKEVKLSVTSNWPPQRAVTIDVTQLVFREPVNVGTHVIYKCVLPVPRGESWTDRMLYLLKCKADDNQVVRLGGPFYESMFQDFNEAERTDLMDYATTYGDAVVVTYDTTPPQVTDPNLAEKLAEEQELIRQSIGEGVEPGNLYLSDSVSTGFEPIAMSVVPISGNVSVS